MTIFSIGFGLALGIGVIVALVATLGLLFIPFNERYLHYMDVLAEKRGLWTVWIVYGLTALGGLMIVMSVVFVTAALGRGVFRPFPWDQFISDYRRHGFWDATFTVLMLLTFYLWAFLIPAHAYATRVANKTGRRPWCPYVINILVGLLLSTPHNPIFFVIIGGAT